MTLDSLSSSAFREQARALLTLIAPAGHAPRVFDNSGLRLVVAEHVNCPDRYSLQEVLLVRRDFQCGTGCRFEGPIYVGGNVLVGKGSVIGAICSDGGMVLGLGARVERWADSGGLMDLRSGAFVRDAVSDHGIQLAFDASAGTMFAPAILSHCGASGLPDPPSVRDLIEIPRPASGSMPELGAVRGFQPEKLSALGAETWVYDGSLTLPLPVYLKSKLVVRGSFSCPPGSLLEDDVKCGGTLRVGQGSIVRARLVSRGEMTLENDCLFEGTLEAGLSLRLCSGVRGFRANSPVEASARERLILEPNVVVRGRLSSSMSIQAGQPLVEGGLELLLAEG